MGNILLDRLLVVFGAPGHVDQVEAYLAELQRQVVGFSTNTLDCAADRLIRTGGKSWPSPKAIVEACVDAQEAIVQRQAASILPHSSRSWPWEIHAEQADEWARSYCRQTGIGLQAFSEGWGRSLLNWARSYARECYRRDAMPSLDARPSSDEVIHWKAHCRCLPHRVADEKEILGPAPLDLQEAPEW